LLKDKNTIFTLVPNSVSELQLVAVEIDGWMCKYWWLNVQAYLQQNCSCCAVLWER